MNGPARLALLIDGLCDDFERLWRRAARRGEAPPDLDAFAAAAPPEARAALEALAHELLAGAAWPEVPGYAFVAEIARGPMGIVYRVRRDADGRELALKALQSATLSLWSRPLGLVAEGEVLTGLRHPNIVPVECFGEHAGLPYLVMPLVEGGDLRRRRDEFIGDTIRVAGLMAKVADAVGYLHGQGVLHRDLKPSNILLTPDGEPLVCDFGLSSRVGGGSPGMVGTLAYMAPEQLAGREATPASDIWAMGAMLRELSPEGLEAVWRRCLRDDPAERCASADELAAACRSGLQA